MKFGSHISIDNGIENAPLRAAEIGAECFQIFTKPPQGGSSAKMLLDKAEIFKNNLKLSGITNFYIHAPYYINLASFDNKVYYSAIKAIRDDLEEGTLLGARYVITHIGSAKNFGKEESLKKVIEAFKKILDGYKGSVELLIENSAGAGNIIGDDWAEIGEIIKKTSIQNLAGICFDTAHAFESGYDLRTKKSLNSTMAKLDKFIGIEKIKVFHCNDSLTELGSHKDRHADIGKGNIGIAGFREIIRDPRFSGLDMVLETPGDDEENLSILKKLRLP